MFNSVIKFTNQNTIILFPHKLEQMKLLFVPVKRNISQIQPVAPQVLPVVVVILKMAVIHA